MDYWIDAKLTLKPNDNQSDNPYTIEKTHSSVTEKTLPPDIDRNTVIAGGIVTALVAGLSVWFVTEPTSATLITTKLGSALVHIVPKLLATPDLTVTDGIVVSVSAVVKEVLTSHVVPDYVAELITPQYIEQVLKTTLADVVVQKPDLTLLFQQLIAEQDKWYNSVFESYGKIIMGTLILMLLFLGVMFLKKRK